MDAIFISVAVIGLSGFPGFEAEGGPIRPHPRSLLLGVIQSNPGVAVERIKVLDQGRDKIVFLLTVDGRQVGSLRYAVQLRVRPRHQCGHVLVAAAGEAEPERGTAAAL